MVVMWEHNNYYSIVYLPLEGGGGRGLVYKSMAYIDFIVARLSLLGYLSDDSATPSPYTGGHKHKRHKGEPKQKHKKKKKKHKHKHSSRDQVVDVETLDI